MANPNSISWNSESEDDDNLFEEGKGPEDEQWLLPPAEESKGIFTTEGGNDLFDQIMGDAEQESSDEATEDEESTEGGIFSRIGETESESEGEDDGESVEGAEAPVESESPAEDAEEASTDTEELDGAEQAPDEPIELEEPVTGESEGELHHEDEVSLSPPVENLAEEVGDEEPSEALEEEEQVAPTEAIDESPGSEVAEDEGSVELEEETPEPSQEEELPAEETAIETEDEQLVPMAEEAGEEAEADMEGGPEDGAIEEEPVEGTENEPVASEESEEDQAADIEDLGEDSQEEPEQQAEELTESPQEEGEEASIEDQEPGEIDEANPISEEESVNDIAEKVAEEPEYEEVEIPLDEVAQETDPPAEELAELAESEILDDGEETTGPAELEENETEEETQLSEEAEVPAEESSESAEEESEEESERQKILKQIRQRVDAEFQNEASKREANLPVPEKGAEKSVEDYMIDLDTLNMGLLVHYLSKRRDRKLGERIDDTNKDLADLRKETENISGDEAEQSQIQPEHDEHSAERPYKPEDLTVPENSENPLENSHFITSQPENMVEHPGSETTAEGATTELSPVHDTEQESYVAEELSQPQQSQELDFMSPAEGSVESESNPVSNESGAEYYAAQRENGSEVGNEIPEEESFEQRQEKKGLDGSASSMATANQSSVYSNNPSATPISDIITAKQNQTEEDRNLHHEMTTEHTLSHSIEHEETKVGKYSSSIKAGFAAGLSIVGVLILYLIIK